MQKIRLDYTNLGIINRLEKINRKTKLRKENNLFRRETTLKRSLKNYYDVKSNLITGKMLEIVLRLEQRLDVFIVRLMLAKSIYESRQLISHGKVLLNNNKVISPSYKVKVGDLIEVKRDPLKINKLSKRILNIPSYLEVNYRINAGIKVREPHISEINYPNILNKVTHIS